MMQSAIQSPCSLVFTGAMRCSNSLRWVLRLWEGGLGAFGHQSNMSPINLIYIFYQLFSDIGTGLLLGGGLSYLAGEFGFSSNSYVELDVVLVTGELVTATATNQYADLFRALKGGANRFGIVTGYKVQAVHVGTESDKNFFGGLIMVR